MADFLKDFSSHEMVKALRNSSLSFRKKSLGFPFVDKLINLGIEKELFLCFYIVIF